MHLSLMSVVVRMKIFRPKSERGVSISWSWIALTLGTSAGPFTNMRPAISTVFVGDFISFMSGGTSPFQFGPETRYVPPVVSFSLLPI